MMRCRSRGRAARALASLALATSVVACVDFTIDTSEIGAVEVVRPGAPAVAAGDTMRDAAGRATPLVVNVYDAGGDLMSGRSIRYVVLGSRIAVTAGGYVIAKPSVTGIDTVFAVVDSQLQSIAQLIEVVPPPDTVSPSGRTADTIRYRSIIADPYDSTTELGVRVASATGANVNKWLVTFALRRSRDGAPITDTTRYAIVRDGRRLSSVDTTDASGVATRRVRIWAPLGTTIIDTLELVVDARHRGAPLKGSPRVFPIIVRPATP